MRVGFNPTNVERLAGGIEKSGKLLTHHSLKKIMAESDAQEPIPLPIDGTLDLHTFRPNEVKDLVPDYLEECRREGITQIRIIHGKGKGVLRRTVHALLDRIYYVADYRIGDLDSGSWGATLVTLEPEPGKNGPHEG